MNPAPPEIAPESVATTRAIRVPINRLFFERRLRWSLTWRGWGALVAFAIAATVFLGRLIHPFLAISEPVNARLLVIEGWIPDYAVASCASLVNTGRYDEVVTVGGPVTGVRSPAATDDTRAYVAAKVLARSGVNQNRIHLVPTHSVSRDRTYHSALALRGWLDARTPRPEKIDVVTLGLHARRSKLLFSKALGEEIEVGVIAIPNAEYDATAWWRYSEGVKEMVAEVAGYLYAKLIFQP